MTQTPTTRSKPLELLQQWATEKADYLSLLTERMEVQKKWAYGEEQARAEYYKPKYLLTKDQVETLQFEIQEVREALQVFDREQQLQALLNDTLGCLVMYNGSDNEHVQRIVQTYRTLYPDTPAPKEGSHETEI